MHEESNGLRGMFIVPSDLEDLKDKGVFHMIEDRTEGGFLGYVLTLHPSARNDRTVVVESNNIVVEMCYEVRSKRGLGRTIQRIVHLGYAVHLACILCRRENIGFIRAQDPFFCGLIGWLTALIRRLPFCISIHADYEGRFILDGERGAPTLFGSFGNAQRVAGFLYRRCNLVLPIRDSLARDPMRAGVPESRIVTFPHAIDMRKMNSVTQSLPRDVREFVRGRNLLLFTGRLSRENYVDDILEIGAGLRDRNDWAIVLMGPGPESERLRMNCSGSGDLAGNVMVAGSYKREVVHAAQKAADIGLCLMGGFSVIEFSALGTPVVSYDVEWHREMIVAGETGELVVEGDVEGIVTAVQSLLDDRETRERMGRAAHQRARIRHDVANVRPGRLAAYRRLVGGEFN